MNPDPTAVRGADVLLRLLAEQTQDVRALDLPGFRRWLADRIAFWQGDPVFAQRCRVRDLRRAHPELKSLEAAHRRAAEADAASPAAERLRWLEQELFNADKAIEGLTRALQAAPPGKRPALQAKLDVFHESRHTMEAERAALARSSPERQALLRATAELDACRAAIGLDREEATLAGLQTERGHRSGRRGEAFEDEAVELTRRFVLPDFPDAPAARVLRGVTLGAAEVEFDQLVVDRARDPVEVLAAVEVKRNVNDLGHGFRRRQGDLAWLTGDTAAYDPASHRTKTFPTGHFDRPATHREGREEFRFGPGSFRRFRRFRRDPATGFFLDGLYLVTRLGPVWGISGTALARINSRVATDDRWDPENEAYIRELFDWCRSLAEPLETPDVLRLSAADPDRARRVIVAGAFPVAPFGRPV